MKIRNHSRILALVLALVMILPLISIPTFAEDTPTTPQPLYSVDFEDYADEAAADTALGTDSTLTAVASDLKAKTDATGNTYLHLAYNESNANVNVKLAGVALSYATTPTIVLEADYYVSSDATGQFNCQFHSFTANGTGGYWYTLWTMNPVARTIRVGGGTESNAVINLDAWNNIKTVVDLRVGYLKIYVNGALAGEATSNKTKVEVTTGQWVVGKTDTSSTVTTTGYVGIDNAKIWGDVASSGLELPVFFEQDFEDAETKADILTADAQRYTVTVETATLDAEEHGKVFHHLAAPQGEGYYIWGGNNGPNSKLNEYELSADGTMIVSGTAANGVTVENSVINDFSSNPPKTAATTSDTANTWYVVPAAYADACSYGIVNIAGNGTRFANTPNVYFRAGAETVTVSAQYYFSADANVETQVRFYANIGSANAAYDVLQLNAASGSVSIANHGDAGTISDGAKTSVATGTWINLDLVFNGLNGQMKVYVNGVYAFSITDKNFTEISYFTANQLAFTMHTRGKNALDNKGYIEIDNVVIAAGEHISAPVLANVNFENQTVGAVPSYGLTVNHTNNEVDNTKGSKTWKIDFANGGDKSKNDAEGDCNVDKFTYLNHAALNYNDHPVVVFSADYFIVGGSKGRIQSQFNGVHVNGAAAINYQDLYQLNGDGGSTWKLQREGGTDHGSKQIKTDCWNNVAAELNLVTGKLNVYLNGELIINSWLNMGDSAARTNLTIDANRLLFGKVNKFNGSGTFYVDNLKMTVGAFNAIEATQQELEDFEAFKYAEELPLTGSIIAAPALATYKVVDGNTVLRLGMGAKASESTYALYSKSADKKYDNISYTPGDTTVTYNDVPYTIDTDPENGNLPYVTMSITKDGVPKDHKFYIISSAAAEAAYGGGNAGSALKLFTNTISYENATTAVLEEKLFLEAGSTGILESQFEGYKYEGGGDASGGWLQLFHLYMEDGLIWGQGGENYGVRLNVGEWNTVKIVVDLVAGNFTVYANGVLARTYSCGKTNIILDQPWIPVKVQRHNSPTTGAYKGGILVDDVRVSAQGVPTPDSQYGDNFLTDADFEAFVADMLTAIEGASIRLTLPAGLRFASVVDTAKLSYLTTHAKAETAMGTLIAPEAYKTEAGDVFTKEALDALNHTVNYIDVKFDGDYFDGAVGVDVGDNKVIAGSIVNIKEANVDLAFAGAAYVEITIGDATYAVYADAQVRSVQGVATALKDANDGVYDSLTATPKDIVDKFAAGETIYTEIEA